MSSRVPEKERAKQQRLDRERERADGERRSRARRRAFSAVAAVALVLGVLAVVALGPRNSHSGAQAEAPFQAHYAGLDTRRAAAHVPTMMDTMNSPVHFHPRLTLELDGKPLTVPPDLGIDPSKDSMQMADLHTHDGTGTIHVEGMADPTLAQFFAVWGVPLSANRFGPYRGAGVRMWVNDKPSRAFGKLKLADRQQIKVVVTSARKAS